MLISPSVAYLLGLIIVLVWQVICFVRKISAKKNFIFSLFIVYMSLLIGVTLFPLPIGIPHSYNSNINFIPFKSIHDTLTYNSIKQIIIQLLGNVIMFFPLGILLQFMNKPKKQIENLIIAVCLAFLIELLQLIIGLVVSKYLYRSVDIDDVILNTLGYLIGFAFYLVIPRKLKKAFL